MLYPVDSVIEWNLESYSNMFKNKHVLDLACHNGDSTRKIKQSGSSSVVGVDIRNELINHALSINQDNDICYFCNDFTDYNFLDNQVKNVQVITQFGALYHMFDHFRFFSHILKPNIEYILLETLYGPETSNPSMFWGYEPVDFYQNGWMDGVDTIPNGTPNLSWIIQSANIFNFNIDFVEKRYAVTNFENITDQETNKRMIVRLYNSKLFPNIIPLSLNEIWMWNDNNKIIGII
jgi:ubiquinone/menaquinone biosynthesis C-methylase UbiE